jgi:hypothetical protein
MPLWWPFRRREPVKTGYDEIEYTAEEDTDQTLSDRSHIEDEAFQGALATLTGSPDADQSPVVKTEVVADERVVKAAELGSLIDTASMIVATSTEADPNPGEDDGEWVDNNDGYWYWRKEDGTFDETPHIKRPDGGMEAYSS